MKPGISIAVLLLPLVIRTVPAAKAQELYCYSGWTAAYKCMEHCGPCGGGSVREPRFNQPAPAPPDPAIAAGDAASARRDWDAAILSYGKALQTRPNDTDLLAHLRNAMDQRQMEINARIDAADSASLQTFLNRTADQAAAASLQATLNHAADESAAAQLNALYDNARNSSNLTATPSVRLDAANLWRSFPVFRHPAPAGSPPMNVILDHQARIHLLDRKITQAREALHRLIASNATNEQERAYWVSQSEEATVDAQDLGLSLFIDLLGEHAGDLAKHNHETREKVMNRLLEECDRNGPSRRIVDGYKSLLVTKHDLERLQQEIRLAGKENELREKIRDFSMNRAESNLEFVWDVASQFEIVERLTGPWADILNASYTIYRQATAVQQLTLTQHNDEKTYQAVQTLLVLIKNLEKQKSQLAPSGSR